MNIERHRIKVFNIILALFLAAGLLAACAAPQHMMPYRDGGFGFNQSGNPMQPESAQTGPIGNIVIVAGITLLGAGLIALVTILILLVRRNMLHHPTPA